MLPNAQIAGRLKHSYKSWDVQTGNLNISAIAKGYQIPCLYQPNQKKIPGKSNFNQNEKEVVSSENENLLKKVATQKVCQVSRRGSIFEQRTISKEKGWMQQFCQLETKPIYPIQLFQNGKSTFNKRSRRGATLSVT